MEEPVDVVLVILHADADVHPPTDEVVGVLDINDLGGVEDRGQLTASDLDRLLVGVPQVQHDPELPVLVRGAGGVIEDHELNPEVLASAGLRGAALDLFNLNRVLARCNRLEPSGGFFFLAVETVWAENVVKHVVSPSE